MAALDAVQARIAEVCGVLNAAHGELVALVGRGLALGAASGAGIMSPAHWVRWQCGVGEGTARTLVALAERSEELPTAVTALAEGALSLDQAGAIAELAPTSHEASITELAQLTTVRQLRKTLRDYGYGSDVAGDPRPTRRTPSRGVSMGRDGEHWRLRAVLDADEGAVVQAALRAVQDRLEQDAVAGEQPDQADALVAMADGALAARAAAQPGTDRFLIHLHLRAGVDGEPLLHPTLDDAWPTWLRNLHSCDAHVRTLLEADGQPIAVGRRTPVISGRLRRAIHARDRGCRFPGCGATNRLHVHHIVRWEHGGRTDPINLISLCRFHHRAHHKGAITITGTAASITVVDARGRPIAGGARPQPPPEPPPPPARRYRHPLGERLDPSAVWFAPNAPPQS